MTKQGMCVCYTKKHNLTQLKEVTEEHKKEILEKYYDPHHKKFEEEVEKILKQNKKCLIIDCHSFPSNALPYELYKDFKGTIVPLKYYKKEKRVQSIMIELNRKLYMNEEIGDKIENFKKLKIDLNYLFNNIRI